MALSKSGDFRALLDRRLDAAAAALTNGDTFIGKLSVDENRASANYTADLMARHVISNPNKHGVFKNVIASGIGSFSWAGWTINGKPKGFLEVNIGPHHITNSDWIIKDGIASVAFPRLNILFGIM